MKIFLTGATGFIGNHLLAALSKQHEVACFGRSVPSGWTGEFISGELENIDQSELDLSGVDLVVHCAARVHVLQENASDPLNEFRKINTKATVELAQKAASSGVKRFVFLARLKSMVKRRHQRHLPPMTRVIHKMIMGYLRRKRGSASRAWQRDGDGGRDYPSISGLWSQRESQLCDVVQVSWQRLAITFGLCHK